MKRVSVGRAKTIIYVTVSAHILGIILFQLGFFSQSRPSLGFASVKDLPNDFGIYSRSTNPIKELNSSLSLRHNYRQHFKKLVIILIDALRADFIPSIKSGLYPKSTMPFVEGLIKVDEACAFESWASNPTVTLPRIKATMTGSIPGFLDVLTNLQGASVTEDNFLRQANAAHKKIVFYGDDTWEKMFPGIFTRAEGTVSFYVTDYTEVDANVTHNVKKELIKNDWDIMILHYLGLDHLGHTVGPMSPLVPTKLKEMDDIVKEIHGILSKTWEPSAIVIFGDHGMTSSGNHGGVSESEMIVPIIFISTGKAPSPEKPTAIYNRKHLQVDIAPTLAVLMGVPIPKNNIGSVLAGAMNIAKLSKREQLYALYYNSLQLLDIGKESQLYERYNSKFANIISLHRIWEQKLTNDISMFRSIKSGYIALMEALSNDLASVGTKYDLYTMVIGCLSIIASLLMVITATLDYDNLGHPMGFEDIALGLFGLGLALALHCAICITADSTMCSSFVWIAPAILMTFFFYNMLKFLRMLILGFDFEFFSLGINSFIVYACILHGLSLGSSSFIEEEHQTWYFFAMTLILLLFLRTVRDIVQSLDLSIDVAPSKNTFIGNSSTYVKSLRFKCMACASLLLVTRLLRAWNQTGNKWASLPDVTDWLASEQHKTFLLLFSLISMIIIGCILKTSRVSQMVILGSSLTLTLFFHAENSNLPNIFPLNKITISRFVFVIILLGIVEVYAHPKFRKSKSMPQKCAAVMKSVSCAWVLLFTLITRTQNIPLVAMLLIQERLTYILVWKQPMPLSIRTVTYFWMGMCAFFYQGNSNMISTLDVAAGYVGLTDYHPVIVGTLLVCHTYGGLVFWLLHYLCCLTELVTKEETPTSFMSQVFYSLASLLSLRFYACTVYTITVVFLRYHLFIWSVFAPKLLYESVHSIVITIFSIIVLALASIMVAGK